MKTIIKLLPALLLILIAGCAGKELSVKPERKAIGKTPISHDSAIFLSTRVSLSKIQSELNASIPKTIAQFEDTKGDCLKKHVLGVQVTMGCEWEGMVKKRGDIVVRGNAGRIHFSIPIHAWVTVKTKGAVEIKNTIKTDLTLSAYAKPSISENWELSLDVDTDFKWDKKPTLYLFDWIKIPIGNLVEPEFKKQLSKAESQLEAMAKKQAIRADATNVWNKLHDPTKTSSDPDVWLRTEPLAIYFSGINVENDILDTTIGIKAKLETFVGDQPKKPELTPLPPLSKGEIQNKDFTIGMPINISYASLIKELAKGAKLGKKWAPSKEKPDELITVKAIDVYPSGDKLAIAVQFDADWPGSKYDTKGTIYLTGKPVVDNEKRQITFEDLKFTRVTDNKLINVVTTIFSGQIHDHMKKSLTYDFGKSYDDLIKQANAQINRDLNNGIRSSGKLSYVKVEEILVLEKGLRLSIKSSGQLQINIGL